jgi:site-specific DNA recombinase
MPHSEPPRIGVYARLSHAAEVGDRETSTDRQVADCLGYARLRGWDVAGVYRDEGRSGFDGSYRAEFERLMDDADAGAVDGLLAWKLDRFSRNRADWHRIMTLVDRGEALASVVEHIDSTTPAGRVMIDLLAMFARMESEAISQRTAAAFAAMARAGKPRIAGRRPFGREVDRVTPNPTEAAEIQRLAERLLDGDSLRGLALELNRRGVRTGYGKQWTPSAVRRVVTQRGNIGDLVYKGEVAARGVLPPLLDEDVYRQVVELLSHPGRRTHAGRPRSYILTGGLARCGHPGTSTIGHVEGICGNPLVSRPESTGWRRYICLLDGKVHLSCTADGLERHVEELALEALTGPRLKRALAPGRDSASRQLSKQLADDEEALKQLRDDYYEHHLIEDRQEFLARQLRLRDRIDQRRAQLARKADRRVLAKLPPADQLLDAWAQWSLERRRSIYDATFVAVIVRPGRRGMRHLDTDRVEPVWRI